MKDNQGDALHAGWSGELLKRMTWEVRPVGNWAEAPQAERSRGRGLGVGQAQHVRGSEREVRGAGWGQCHPCCRGCQGRRGICSSHGSDTSRVTEVSTEVVCGLGEQPASYFCTPLRIPFSTLGLSFHGYGFSPVGTQMASVVLRGSLRDLLDKSPGILSARTAGSRRSLREPTSLPLLPPFTAPNPRSSYA